MASISAPGSGSGIDVGSLVSQLIAAESQPTTARLNAREAEFTAQFTAFGQLRSALAGLAASLATVGSPSTFRSRAATVADETLFTATAGASAVPGRYSIEVVRLAQAQKLVSAGFAGSDAPVGSGSISITAGEQTFTVAVAPGADTLAAVRDAINRAPANPGVRATLVRADAPGGGTETRLSLSAAATGTDNAITVTAIDDDGDHTDAAGISRLVYDPNGSGATNLTETAAAVDAEIRIDSQPLTSPSNLIDGAIDGLTLSLVAAAPGSPTTLAVEIDAQPVARAVTALVQSYNALRQTINGLTAFDPVTSEAGVLLGDSGVRALSGRLQRELTGTVSGVEPGLASLAQLGVATERNGTLRLDAAALQAALDADLEGVAELFTSDDGIATRLSSLVESFTGPRNILDTRSEALEARLRDITSQRELLARRMEEREEALLRRFSAMDAIVAQLQSTSTFLTQQLSAISALAVRNDSNTR